MIEIKNRTPGPIQLMVRSFSKRNEHPKAFTTLTIPGFKTILLEDDEVITKYLERNKNWGLLSYVNISNSNKETQ